MKNLFGLSIIAAGLLLSSACMELTVGQFHLIARPQIGDLNQIGYVRVDAACKAGEQLLGGDYYVNKPGTGTSLTAAAIEASYPSAPDTWSVIAFNPDVGTNDPADPYLIIATAYCLTTPNYDVGISIQRSAAKMTANDELRAQTMCPSGATLTGGGFQTSHLDDNEGITNTSIVASHPLKNTSSGVSSGWYLQQDLGTGSKIPDTFGYAVCARQRLQPSTARSQNALMLPGQGRNGLQHGPLDCNTPGNLRYFTTGGGFEFLAKQPGEWSLPHWILYSAAVRKFRQWDLQGSAPGNGEIGDIQIWAVCIPVPDI